MVQPSDGRQIRHFRRRRDHARRQAYAVGAPPIPKPQKVEGIPVELALLRQVHQHLSPDQHASPRDGSLRLGATTVTTTTGWERASRRSSCFESLFFLGAGFARSTSNTGAGTGADDCVCAPANSAIIPFKSTSARVLRGAEPFTSWSAPSAFRLGSSNAHRRSTYSEVFPTPLSSITSSSTSRTSYTSKVY